MSSSWHILVGPGLWRVADWPLWRSPNEDKVASVVVFEVRVKSLDCRSFLKTLCAIWSHLGCGLIFVVLFGRDQCNLVKRFGRPQDRVTWVPTVKQVKGAQTVNRRAEFAPQCARLPRPLQPADEREEEALSSPPESQTMFLANLTKTVLVCIQVRMRPDLFSQKYRRSGPTKRPNYRLLKLAQLNVYDDANLPNSPEAPPEQRQFGD